MHSRHLGVLNWNPLTEERAGFWVTFHGAAAVTIDGSYNVSSMTYVSTGDYTITFAQPFAGATRYALAGQAKPGNVAGLLVSVCVKPAVVCNAGSVEINTNVNAGSLSDASVACVAGWGHT